MKCKIYGTRRHGTYLYLREDISEKDLPEDLAKTAGTLHFVMDFDLESGKKLRQVDIGVLKDKLSADGWFLFIESKDAVEKLIAGSATK